MNKPFQFHSFHLGRVALVLTGLTVSCLLQAQSVDSEGQEMLETYCTKCHNLDDFAGGLALDLLDSENLLADVESWEKVLLKVKAGMMPPLGEERPDNNQMHRFASELAHSIDTAWEENPIVGAPLLHRMNRTEYQNAIRDLLDLPINTTEIFPVDSSSEGFDNMSSVLTVSPSLMQAYISAANRVSRLAVGDLSTSQSISNYSADQQNQSSHLEGITLGTRGGLTFEHVFPLDADYEFSINLSGMNSAFSLASVGTADPVELVIDGQRVELFPAGAERKVTLTLPAGPHTIESAFIKTQSPVGVDDLHSVWSNSTRVRSVSVIGPMNITGSGDTPSRRKVFICSPSTLSSEQPCAEQILENLAYRAYRHPPTERSMETLMSFYREGRELGNFDTGIQYALSRILVDPQFIFRFEEEPEDAPSGTSYPLAPYELASRLSFFIWSSIPDSELLALAESGRLLDEDVLKEQIHRMLHDEKSEALVQNFATSWLSLQQLGTVNPTSESFDGSLRVAMRRETELLLEAILLEDRPILELLTADYTFVNERLAQHYGIPNIRGSHYRRVGLEGTGRHGLLGHSSILTITSAPNRTSPVIRGAWIMENILGAPPPPPPPGVEVNLDDATAEGEAITTLRQRLELHRSNPSCAACHNMMDPIGFALENFDATGKFRTQTEGVLVDTSAIFWDGLNFSGPDDLNRILTTSRSELFIENFTEKLFTYALGRKIEYYDMPTVRQIVSHAEDENFRFSTLVQQIVMSDAFTHRTKAYENVDSAQR